MAKTTRLSAVVTSFNSEATLERCLASVAFCDEIVVLDSGSTDQSQDIARRGGARVEFQAFLGYAAQKQAAIDRASHDWVLLLDSDEWLAEGADAIRSAVGQSGHAGYALPRREWLFWTWQHPASRHNRYVRLFDRRRARMSGHAVHETVVASGSVGKVDAMIHHAGDRRIEAKVEKANRYSSLQQQDLAARPVRWLRLRMVCYPGFAFFRYFVLRGHWRSGWAGFIAARVHAFYAFQKYAKRFEHLQQGNARFG